MAADERMDRKRKSAELRQVFEVSAEELSPEEAEGAEPPIKLPRTSGVTGPAPNLKVTELGGSPKQIHEISDDSDCCIIQVTPESSEVFVVVDSIQEAPEELNGALPSKNGQVIDLAEEEVEEGEVNDDPEPQQGKTVEISVKFYNQAASDRYQQAFREFLASLSDLEVECVDDLTLNAYRPERGTDPKPNRRRRKKWNSETEGLFVVDTTPSPAHQRPQALRYQSSKLQIHEEPPEEQKSSSRSRVSCFNCAEPHDLRSCPHPRNFQTINANRQKFMQRSKTTRYHLGDAVDSKFGHLKPGQLSQQARKALRLKKNQLPSYIYKMRVIGYPPGWLEEAKVGDDHELEIFDIEGRHVKSAGQRASPGLDPDKIVDYPGFNIPIEEPFKDEYKYHRVAPYSDKFHKKHMIEAYRLQALKERNDFQLLDMDSSCSALEPSVAHQESEIDSDSNNDTSTVSLVDLQKQKETLIAEIQRAAETVPWATEATEPAGAAEATEPAGAAEATEPAGAPEATEPAGAAEATEPARAAEATEPVGATEATEPTGADESARHSVRKTVYGTPILKSDNSFTNLPAADNFTKGVSAVIDFENLPNSTGKYEQMSDVLKKVRSTMKTLSKS